MKEKKLEDIMLFSLGKNTSRLNTDDIVVYTQEDFEKDLQDTKNLSTDTECIINLIKSKAAPLSEANSKKCITANFLKCSFDTQILDPWFFCYQFNESKHLLQQINMFHQGTTLSVKKLTVKNIRELKIPFLNIERQKVIGSIYKQMLMQKHLMVQQTKNIERLSIEIIKKIEED